MSTFEAISASVAKTQIRTKAGGFETVKLNRGSAIRAFCKECQGWDIIGITECTSPYCPLFPFRNGGSVTAALKKAESDAKKSAAKAAKKAANGSKRGRKKKTIED